MKNKLKNKFENRSRISAAVSIALGAGLLGTGFTSAALAQQPVERIEITGSAIKRIEQEGALPVQTISREEIQRSGATSTTELVQSLPAMQGYTSTTESVGGGGGGFAEASLRNLGGQRTLVLLNGRRLAGWAGQTLTGYGDGIDLNTIPIAAIERIEVLTDGASALYGTDAIAGVVNFITRSNYEKFDVSIGMSKPQHPGGKEDRISLTKGFGNLSADGFNVLFAYSKDKKNLIRSVDREFSKTGNIFFDEGGQTLNFGNFSSRSIPANVLGTGIAGTPLGDFGIANPYWVANGGNCPAGHVPEPTGAPFCYFDYVTTVQIQPEQRRENFLLSGNLKLGRNHTAYADYVHSESKVLARIAPAPVDLPILNTNPFYPIAQALGADPVANDAIARLRMMDAGSRTELDTTKAEHIVLGIKGLAWGWDYDASYVLSKNSWRQDYVKGWFASNELVAALNAQVINPFAEAGQQTPAGMAAIDGAQFNGEYRRGSTKLEVLSLRGSRDVFKIGGGVAALGLGIDTRKERATYTPSAIAMGQGNVIAGDAGAERPFDVGRRAWGIYGELQVPFTKGLEGTLALRHDDYSDFGKTDNAKVSLRWAPSKQWLFRASAGTGYKAPAVPQMSNVQQLYGVTGGSYACPFAVGDPLEVGCVAGASQYNVFAAGNTALQPEKSNQHSIGARWEPTNDLSFGVDYWNVRVKDSIGQIDESVVFGNPVQFRNLFGLFTDPTTNLPTLFILLQNANLGEVKASGLDFDFVGRFKTPVGRLTSRVLWTHMLEHKFQRQRGTEFISDLGIFTDGGVTFKNIWRWFNTLESGPWSATLAVNYKSSYRDQAYSAGDCVVTDLAGNCAASARQVKEYVTADLQATYTWKKSLKLTGGVINIADTNPPLSIKNVGGHQLGYDNRYTDARGRTYYVNLSYEF